MSKTPEPERLESERHEEPERFEDEEELEPQPIPKWVPVLIGLVLVAIAALAVYTGIRMRGPGMVERRTRPPVTSPAPPGEPQPGASLIYPGEGGENVPAANEPVQGTARAVVTGDRSGVEGVVRMWARRGMMIVSEPPDAMVSVNGMPLGQASQFDTADEIYDFAAPGSYDIRVTAAGYRDRSYVVTSDENAKDEIATIKVRLERVQ